MFLKITLFNELYGHKTLPTDNNVGCKYDRVHVSSVVKHHRSIQLRKDIGAIVFFPRQCVFNRQLLISG